MLDIIKPKNIVVARFDEAAENKLNNLRTQLFDAGCMKEISPYPPHITIAAYEGVELDTLLQWTDEFTKKYAALEILMSSLGVLPPGGEHTETAVLFASPSPSKALIDFYYAFHENLDEFCGNIGWMYSAKSIHPYAIHSTIGIFEIAKLQKAMKIIFEHQIFEMAKIIALEVYARPIELIKRFDLDA